ncbi:MAG TPA: C25 family cysteine peptidase, partial [Flavitalea sp.]|nr:C25 family cysteine peptidase [Flavitalea sp.]
ITGDISTPGIVKLVIPAGGPRDFVLVNTEAANIGTVTSLTPKTFKSFTDPANQGNYLIITNKILYTGTHENNPVDEYKNYRASAAGGGFNVQVVDMDELIDQFGFGIKKNPLAIKNFIRFARNKFAVPVKNIFLIGRGMAYNEFRNRESDPIAEQLNLVPSWGSPASDNMLSSEDAASPVAVTPIGRLSVVRGKEIEDYLEKVKEYESAQKNSPNTLAGREWMKNIVHVTGSSDPYLGTVLCNYMSGYKQIIQDTMYGGKVSTFCKVSTNSVEQLNNEKIAALFEEGISILTYFGHSSSTTLEFNLDNPQTYNNQGKYPVFFVNGCNAGNFFTYNAARLSVNETLSEKFVLARQRGSIAFVASTHFGIVNYLNIYLNNLYNTIAKPDFGRSLGETVRDALQAMVTVTGPDDYYSRLHAEEITIHGDPAVNINEQPKPDYVLEEAQVKVNPAFISVAEESFELKIKAVNLGKSLNDSIYLEVKRQYPDGSGEVIKKVKIAGIRYADSLIINVPIVSTRDKGLNKLTITIDADNTVDEVSESNNVTVKDVFIYEDEARTVYPYNYAIINKGNQHLFASTANPLSANKQYVMEMDTTALFNSAFKISKTLTSTGGLLEFDPGITYTDKKVYYWRVAPVPQSNVAYIWNTASFIYLNGTKEGFNQSHRYQHSDSKTDRMTLDNNGNWVFGIRNNHLFARNGVYPFSGRTDNDFSVDVNGASPIASACVGQSLIFNVFDSITFKPWKNVDGSGNNLFSSGSGSANCTPTRNYNFEFSYMTAQSRKYMMNFMDSIPNGSFVVVRNIPMSNFSRNTYIDTWQSDTAIYGSFNSLYHRLLAAGFTKVDSLTFPRSFIFIYKKGGYDFVPKMEVSQGINDRITLSAECITPDSLGFITSPAFGPAKSWGDVIWNGTSVETVSNDNPTVDVIGIDAAKNETVLYTMDRNTHTLDISSVSAATYPQMKLRMRNIDSVSLSPYQLSDWKIYYQPLPEGAVAPNILIDMKDTLEIGEPLKLAVAFKNVSPYPFDSVAVKLNILDKNNVPQNFVIPKQKPLISGDTIALRMTIDSKNFADGNTLFLEFNPNENQPEQYHFNNFMFKDFYVRVDRMNPLLDVTFDGVHILNRDLVSARPHIQIKLKDDAKFLLLNDTALSSVQIRYPDGTVRTHHFDNDTLRFTPATSSSDNSAVVDFYPSFDQQYNPEGDEYELIVNGKDRSGNKASNEYRIAFTVITKAMISNMLNYPNPFSTSTAFVFTITGSEIPQNMKVQILTVTGKIVREVTKEELGPLHIGRNITDFKWDGNDQFGQKLGNGVYLYRFVTTLNGQRMERYKAKGDNTDMFFNNGYGKMYLMR